ncbi:hypothetical protein HJC23_005854 [Cyclotella cryptica]|uniref:Uncharacterized protein n=1 Tax=Cyclotella cryptica TaxID=29204 RepID=A0ABD3QZ88_9STRA|eukprot:CCRYP_000374-RA/>CCRYP_000374-RA protein AED:0.19 eAED:0.19 QI:242/1/1/1/0/0/2/398/623
MVLHNASDSLADLLQIKQEREMQQLLQKPSAATATLRDTTDTRVVKKQMSFRKKQNHERSYEDFCFEQFELDEEGDQEEDDAPIWEMDGTEGWSGERRQASSTDVAVSASFSDAEGNLYYTDAIPRNEGLHLSIADCERIFTVPEVFDDILKSPCKGNVWRWCALFDICWNSEERFKNRAFRDSVTGKSIILDDDEQNVDGTMDQKVKRMSMAVQLYMDMPASTRPSFNPSLYKIRLGEENGTGRATIIGDHHQRFGLESQYGATNKVESHSHQSNIHKTKRPDKRRVHFSELKRVLKIRKFTPDEATQVWYQREDFDHFKAEMTLLIRDMEASKELAAIWLDSEEAERRRSTGKLGNSSGRDVNNKACHTKSRSWWHDYDHSRRGLERYASPGQARQILASYKVAVQKVLAEQRRQNLMDCLLFCIPSNKNQDAQRIAEIYHEYTAWSSDLALAAGASDADCIRTNFNDETRKTREYYILKQVIKNGYRVHKHMPQFMMPKCITPKGFLDENETLLGGSAIGNLHRQPASRRESIIQTVTKSMRRGSSTGEEAREEMSHVTRSDLAGPIAPALAPSFDVQDDDGEENSASNTSPRMRDHHHNEKQHGRLSLAAKAKNYPFQQ